MSSTLFGYPNAKIKKIRKKLKKAVDNGVKTWYNIMI
jgi:hypothetical protein